MEAWLVTRGFHRSDLVLEHDIKWNIYRGYPQNVAKLNSILNKKRNAHFVNGISFCKTWGAGKYPLHRRTCPIRLLSLSTFLNISELPDVGNVTFMKLPQSETFHLWVWIKLRIWTSVITCKLAVTETLLSTKNNLPGPRIFKQSSTEKGQWVCCKPACGL